MQLPAGLRTIGEAAFAGAQMDQVQLPDSVEKIGERAFEGCAARTVECFETEAAVPEKGKAERRAFADCAHLISAQLPAGITELGENLYSGCPALQNLAWPAGLQKWNPQHFSGEGGLYITLRGQAGNVKKGKLPDQALQCNPGRSIVYLELPAAFAGQLNLGAFDHLTEAYWNTSYEVSAESRMIGTLFVQGIVDGTEPGEEAGGFEDCIREAAYALDADGNRICLYRRQPDSYTKVSRYCSEDSEAYQIEFPAESQLLTEQSFGDFTTRAVRVNADAETAAALAEADIAVYSWYSESEETRALELEEFLEFEDLYLRQPQCRYYRIGVSLEGEEQFSYPGSYQVIFELPPEWDGSATAVYHIDQSGLITRLEGDFYNDGTTKEFRALSSDIGSFAVAAMTHLSQEVQGSFSEERHQMLEEAHREAGEEPISFPMKGGIVSVVRPAEEEAKEEAAEAGQQEAEEAGTVTVFRPETEVLEIQSTGSGIRLEIGLTDLEGRIPILSRKTEGMETEHEEKDGGLLSFLPGSKKDGEISLTERSGDEKEASGKGTVWYETVLEESGQYQLRLETERAGVRAWLSEHPALAKAALVLAVLWILKKLLGGGKRKKRANVKRSS